MSQDEDVELKELVTEALEKNGILARIRAQLRANIFMTLENEREQKTVNPKLSEALSTHDGVLSFLLVQELLEFYSLKQTSSIFRAESGQGKTYFYTGRQPILRTLRCARINEKSDLPVLLQLIKIIFKLCKSDQVEDGGTGENVSHNADSSQDKSWNESETSPKANPQNNTFLVNSGRSDNYDLSFTSESEKNEEKGRLVLQLDLNDSDEKNEEISEQDEIQNSNSSPKQESDGSADNVKSLSEANLNLESKDTSLSFSELSPSKSENIEESVKSLNNSFDKSEKSSFSVSSAHNLIIKDAKDLLENGDENHVLDPDDTVNKSTEYPINKVKKYKINSSQSDPDTSISEEIVQTFENGSNESSIKNDSVSAANSIPENSIIDRNLLSPPLNLLDTSIPETPTTKLKVKEQINDLKMMQKKNQIEKMNHLNFKNSILEAETIDQRNRNKTADSNLSLRNSIKTVDLNHTNHKKVVELNKNNANDALHKPGLTSIEDNSNINKNVNYLPSYTNSKNKMASKSILSDITVDEISKEWDDPS